MTARGSLRLVVANAGDTAGRDKPSPHKAAKPMTEGQRRRTQLATVHVGRKQLGMIEDDYRALLERLTGHFSAKDCNADQLDAVVAEMRRMGFKPAGTPRAASPVGSTAGKARAMWISLYQLGAVHDPSDSALDAFGRRQLGVERIQWANERLAYRLIEALKAMAERHGWDQSVSARMPLERRIRILMERLVGAQLARLAGAGVEVAGPYATDRAEWSDKKLRCAAAELGFTIRSLPKPD